MEDRTLEDKILLINDLPGYGKVALSAMLPVLTHMGFDAYNLPTAIVSNTLDYGKFDILDTTEHMKRSIAVWNELGFSFDAICTGFILTAEQVKLILDYCGEAMKLGTRLYVDPIMGDEGVLYHGVSKETISYMRAMCSKAEIIVPNLTEAAFLAGMFEDKPDITLDEAETLAIALHKEGAKSVVITSVLSGGKYYVTCYDESVGGVYHIPYEHIDVRFVGTGDIFSAVVFGRVLRGGALRETVEYAVRVMRRLILENEDQADKFKGIPLEKNLDIIDDEWVKSF